MKFASSSEAHSSKAVLSPKKIVEINEDDIAIDECLD